MACFLGLFQSWVVVVAPGPRRVKRFRNWLVEGSIQGEALGEVGVGEVGDAEGDGVDFSVGDGLFGFGCGVAHVGNEDALVGGTDGFEDFAFELAEDIGSHDVEVGEIERVELFGEVGVESDGVGVGAAVEAIERRDAEADAVAAPDVDGGSEDFEQEAGAIFPGAAVGAGAFVGSVAEESVEEVTVGAVDLDAIETGGPGIDGGLSETCDNAGEFFVGESAGDGVGLLAFGGVDFVVGDGDGGGGHGFASVVQKGMAGAATVPDLQDDASAFLVDGIGHFFPAGNLGVGVDSGFGAEGGAAFHGHGGFGDEEAGRGALGVVCHHEIGGDVVGISPNAGEGSHENTIGEKESARLKRLEKGRMVHVMGWRLTPFARGDRGRLKKAGRRL